MKLTADYFFSLTADQFLLISKGYGKTQDLEFKDNWNRARAIAYQVYLGAPYKNHEKIIDFWPLPWEQKNEAGPEMSKEQLAKMFTKWDKIKFKPIKKAKNGFFSS